MKTAIKIVVTASTVLSMGIQAEVFHGENVSIDGHLCAGLSCIQGETFGEELLKLKETKIRVKFEDTTSSAGFPTNDWQILINDLGSGGDEYFAIEDSTNAKIPFRIDAGAHNSSLHITDYGWIGMGTSIPYKDLHIMSGDSPGIRLERVDAWYTPFTWDLGTGDSGFYIRESSNLTTPVRISPGAPANSMYIHGDGNIGLGTNAPATRLHINDDDFPTIRLEQSGPDPVPYAWDIRANDSAFQIEDVTSGGTPLQIQTGAGTNAMVISSIGNIGMGIGGQVPGASLHVFRSDGTAKVLIEEYSGIAAPRTLFQLQNKGNTKLGIFNTEAGIEWTLANPGTGLQFSRSGSTDVEMEILNNGNLVVAGGLSVASDVNAKTGFSDIDPYKILNRIAELPVTRWEYKDALGEAHIGPTAQDFHAAFGLGATDTRISTIDADGVALAAIKALIEQNQTLTHRVKELEKQNQRIEELVVRMVTEHVEQIVLN